MDILPLHVDSIGDFAGDMERLKEELFRAMMIPAELLDSYKDQRTITLHEILEEHMRQRIIKVFGL
jgi:hypothetical protein